MPWGLERVRKQVGWNAQSFGHKPPNPLESSDWIIWWWVDFVYLDNFNRTTEKQPVHRLVPQLEGSGQTADHSSAFWRWCWRLGHSATSRWILWHSAEETFRQQFRSLCMGSYFTSAMWATQVANDEPHPKPRMPPYKPSSALLP